MADGGSEMLEVGLIVREAKWARRMVGELDPQTKIPTTKVPKVAYRAYGINGVGETLGSSRRWKPGGWRQSDSSALQEIGDGKRLHVLFQRSATTATDGSSIPAWVGSSSPKTVRAAFGCGWNTAGFGRNPESGLSSGRTGRATGSTSLRQLRTGPLSTSPSE